MRYLLALSALVAFVSLASAQGTPAPANPIGGSLPPGSLPYHKAAAVCTGPNCGAPAASAAATGFTLRHHEFTRVRHFAEIRPVRGLFWRVRGAFHRG